MTYRPLHLLQNPYGRRHTSLGGAWAAIVDPYDNGRYERFFANQKPTTKSDRIEYDFDRSGRLEVPGDWNSQRPELFLYEGTIWYEREFVLEPVAGERVWLYFGAANYEADVYLNGCMVVEHVGGFTSFSVEITDAVRSGDNCLVVRVNSQRRRDGVPALSTDWWNYGGLTRDVLLIRTPETTVLDYSVTFDDGRLRGWLKLDGPGHGTEVALRIAELGVNVTVTADSSGAVEFEAKAEPRLWCPEDPKLYSVTLETRAEQIRDRIGLRTIQVCGSDILLNGEPVFLRGICLHEQAPLREGRAHGEADARQLLGWAKELGANFVRLAHYPHQEQTVRVADELGLLVWAEVPVYWSIAWENEATLANAQRQLGEVIGRDKNRASVIVWSVGNETPSGDARLRFMRTLVETARTLDGSRLISAALLHRQQDAKTQVIDDPLGEDLDVLGCNEYLGWYDGLPPRADGVVWRTPYHKPLIMSELGADALAGLHGDELTRWTEEYQADVYRHQLGMLERIEFLRGLTPWILTDFRSPRRTLPDIQDFYNRKGLISDSGQKKQAFYLLQEFYARLCRQSPSSKAPRSGAEPE